MVHYLPIVNLDLSVSFVLFIPYYFRYCNANVCGIWALNDYLLTNLVLADFKF